MKVKYLFVAVLASTLLGGCGNRDVLDLNYTYTKAIIRLQTGEVVERAVQSWRDYNDGDQIQVKINGAIYLVHSSNVDLINDSN